MTRTETLLNAPCGVFATADAAAFEELRRSLHDSVEAASRLVEGARCRTKAALLAHFAERLGFPSHFGHNWDALHDCLADLDPRPEAQLVLLVAEAADVLAEAPEDVDVLADSLVTLSAPPGPGRPQRGMKVVLSGPLSEGAPLLAALRRLGTVTLLD